MNSMLEELYCGTIYPAENIVPHSSEYYKVNQKISDEMKRWENMLSAEEFKRLEDLRDLLAASHSIEMCETFRYGVSLGAMFILEVFDGKRRLARE